MGFWSTLGKIGLIAGGGIATALTAGAASPLLATAIGAGIGAGTGAGTAAIDHKNIWKGLATGAALGGVTGGVGNLVSGAKGGVDAVSGLVGEGGNVVSKVTPGIVDTLKSVGQKTAIDQLSKGAGQFMTGMIPPDQAGAAPGDEGVPVDAATAAQPGFVEQLKAAGKQLISGPGGVMRIVNAAGNVAGGVAEGMSKGRDKEVANASAVNNMDILQRQNALDARNKNYQDAMRSAFALNAKDARFNNLPPGVNMVHMEGGFRPSAFGAQGNTAAAAMNKQAQAGLDSPQPYLALPDTKAGALENVLGTIGAASKGVQQAGADQSQSTITDLIKKLLAQQKGVGSDGPYPQAQDSTDEENG